MKENTTGSSIQLDIKDKRYGEVTLTVDPFHTIYQVKQGYHRGWEQKRENWEITPDQYVLTLDGKVLEDGHAVSDYNLSNRSTLLLDIKTPEKNSKKRRYPKSKSSLDKLPAKKKVKRGNNSGKNKVNKADSKIKDEEEKCFEFQSYGKLCKVDKNGCSVATKSNDGKCFVCQDTLNTKLPLDHPILLCEGEGCNREFHLKCITSPKPLQEVPTDSFYCVDCDPSGTSACLENYFDAIDELRTEFNSSKELVHFLLFLNGNGSCAKKLLKKYNIQNVNKTFQDARNTSINELLKCVCTCDLTLPPMSAEDVPSSADFIRDCPVSELSRAGELHNAALSVPRFMAIEGGKDKVRETLEQEQTCEKNDTKSEDKKTTLKKMKNTSSKEKNISYDDLNAESLVGKVIRLYCPIDNQYHHGRIIDWRSARIIDASISNQTSSYNDFFEGDCEITQSEFLIRFPAGINGRKKTVMHWAILEEHSIAVSMSMVMAQRDKGRGVNGWKPAQIVLRTIIELLPIKQHLVQRGRYALAIFFGDENHLYADLDKEAVDFFSPSFENYKINKMNCSPNVKKSYVQGVAAFMDMAMALAQMELEEQRRTFEWHKLMLLDYAHPQCLSMKSEYGLPPLVRKSQNIIKHEEERKESALELNSTQHIEPKLCPLIQQGLDRQYLCDQLSDEEFNLDTIATMQCSLTNLSRAQIIAEASVETLKTKKE